MSKSNVSDDYLIVPVGALTTLQGIVIDDTIAKKM